MNKMIGISKAAFLDQRVVPATSNDKFNDNNCSFCGSSYDDQHPGVRNLPCNHVFGQLFLLQMRSAPHGDKCPICRTPLFRHLEPRNYHLGFFLDSRRSFGKFRQQVVTHLPWVGIPPALNPSIAEGIYTLLPVS
ncbi:hypothetical protein ACN47E_006242 [Coniothyrium glycines]